MRKITLALRRSIFFLAITSLLFAARSTAAAADAASATASTAENSASSASECLIVYPLDQFPEVSHGSRYIFYGNGFFINHDGYLLTAAHVVSSFRDGGQPYVLVGARNGAHHLVPAELVAADWDHDVALLRATPNPFANDDSVRYLPITIRQPSLGREVTVLSMRPVDQQNANSAEPPLDERLAGKLLTSQFSQGETEGTGRELFAVSQPILPGQSGSPVVSSDSHEVIGIVLGRWVSPGVISLATAADSLASAPGAVLPIHYAVALLHGRGVAWESSSVETASASAAAESQGDQAAPAVADANTPPVPVSIVGTPYPPQALFGGEVVLDAQIDANGNLAELNVVSGQPPFLGAVLDAVRTWSFQPGRVNGVPTDGHLSVIFQFPQSYIPPLTSQERTFAAPPADVANRSAVPLYTREPNYPFNTVAEGAVALFATIDQQGQVDSSHVLLDLPPLTDASIAALHLWRFAPAEQSDVSTESAAVVVFIFRRPAIR